MPRPDLMIWDQQNLRRSGSRRRESDVGWELGYSRVEKLAQDQYRVDVRKGGFILTFVGRNVGDSQSDMPGARTKFVDASRQNIEVAKKLIEKHYEEVYKAISVHMTFTWQESSARERIAIEEASDKCTSPDDVIDVLRSSREGRRRHVICEIEMLHFNVSQCDKLLPLLWTYILENRDSNDPDELIAVGSAIRKYIALVPMSQMGRLAFLLEPGHRSALPIDLEIEVAKMIYRNFEVHPPGELEPQPTLAQRLLEIVLAYTNPRVLLRDKHAAAASYAIEAIVAMRSHLAESAWLAAVACPHRWFGELVNDHLVELRSRWNNNKNSGAVAWLDDLRRRVVIAG